MMKMLVGVLMSHVFVLGLGVVEASLFLLAIAQGKTLIWFQNDVRNVISIYLL